MQDVFQRFSFNQKRKTKKPLSTSKPLGMPGTSWSSGPVSEVDLQKVFTTPRKASGQWGVGAADEEHETGRKSSTGCSSGIKGRLQQYWQ